MTRHLTRHLTRHMTVPIYGLPDSDRCALTNTLTFAYSLAYGLLTDKDWFLSGLLIAY